MDKRRSLIIFIGLILLYGLLTGLNVFLPQGDLAAGLPPAQMPAGPPINYTDTIPTVQMPTPMPVVALVAGIGVVVVYGALGLVGLFLWRKLGLPEIWDGRVTNRQRFLVPAIAGGIVGLFIIIGDLVFRSVNGIGPFPHPPFPTSIVAALAAGIGEETIFRLFFISLWTWLVSGVILRGRAQPAVYWIVAVLSAVAFAMSHLPSIMFLKGWTEVGQVPPVLMLELLLLNGVISLVGAYYFRKYGFLATAGVHFWADIIWHVVWGVVG
jgi:hypothetical protein